MKRFLQVVFILFFTGLFLFVLFGCGGKSSDTPTVIPIAPNNPVIQRTIHGQAAIGAFIEEGAQVQVRPASVDGLNPEALIEGVVGADGNYTVTIPESIPAIPDEPNTLTKSIMKSVANGTMENGTGFIIRVWSASAGSWVYSYSENDGADTVANVNPYTDMFVRRFYASSNFNNDHVASINDHNIDYLFSSGVFADGFPVNIPETITVNNAMSIMAKLLFRIYSVPNIQNALVDTWQVDLGLDALLTAGGRGRLNEFLQREFEYLIWKPDFITDGYAEQPQVGLPVDVEIWTTHGDTGTATMRVMGVDYLMTKEADSVPGANHFKGRSDTIIQMTEYAYASVTFSEDGYNGYIAVRIQ